MFKRNTHRYGDTPQPETPYQRAGQLWDERIGSARGQAKNWRLMAFGSLVLSMSVSGALIWLSMQSRVTPYVIEVDKQGGVQAIAPAPETYKPSDAQIAYQLGRFIQDVRSLPLDPIVLRKNWLEAYDFATDRAAQILNDYARNADPFKKVGQRSIAVEVTSVVRASDNSFQVQWQEQTYEQNQLARSERWTGLFTLVVRTPRTAEALRKNPLGIYIHGLDWSRDLTPGENK
jgi:type IV secretion system protein VirB5